MLWSDVRGTFASAAGAVAALLDEVDAWDAPALGEWDVAALAGHVLRQVDARRPQRGRDPRPIR